MARKVEARAGDKNVVLPRGWVLDEGDQAVLSDAEWEDVQNNVTLFARIVDLGDTADPVGEVPTWRDVQQMVVSGPGTGGGGMTLEEDPSDPGTYLIVSGGSLTEDPSDPGTYLIGA